MPTLRISATLVLLCAAGAFSSPIEAQGSTAASRTQVATQSTGALSTADVARLADVHVALSQLQDSLNAVMAASRNKTPEAQVRLREELRAHVATILTAAGLDNAEYQRRRLLVSSDDSTRAAFDRAVSKKTGAPLPGTVVAAAPAAAPGAAQPELPSGPVGVHAGHVLVSFGDTPEKAGLLPTALTEAGIAAQHAALATRTPDDLAAMQRHAAHVIHAIDPAIVATGPGKGYGVKRAATGVAAHVELAGKSVGAAAGVVTHAGHVAMAARAVVARADAVVALAERIRVAKSAAEAAALVGQLSSLAAQLATGVDADADGRVSFSSEEGGLEQASQHMQLLLSAAKPR